MDRDSSISTCTNIFNLAIAVIMLKSKLEVKQKTSNEKAQTSICETSKTKAGINKSLRATLFDYCPQEIFCTYSKVQISCTSKYRPETILLPVANDNSSSRKQHISRLTRGRT